MNIKELLGKLHEYGSRERFVTETFLLNLLKIHLISQGKNLYISDGLPTARNFDAFVSEGFDDFKGLTFIEVVSSPNRLNLLNRLKNSVSFLKSEEVDYLLIVTLRISPLSIRKEIEAIASKINTKIVIWGPHDIQVLIDKYQEQVENLSENLFTLRLETAIKKPQTNWKENRTEILLSVAKEYERGQFSFFLGAGVSSSAGLPDWDTLLNSLFVSILTSEIDEDKKIEDAEISSIVRRLRDIDEPSALMSARYIRKGLTSSRESEQEEFIEAITSNLYRLRDKRKSLDSPLIGSISSLCTPGRMGENVKSVITYNFDDLLERSLGKRDVIHRSIFEETELPNRDELPIYHVHGYLPENRSEYNNLERSTLVFSEEGYHKIYNEPYHWSNLVQLNHLKETTCLMIGLSMTDPNLRRLLEISSRSMEIPRHYAFMKRMDIDSFSKEHEKKVVQAPLSTISKFLDRHHSLNEGVLKELGVNIIWYEKYEEIPEMLGNLR